jgi:DNA-binding NtrC family response regulator
MLGLHFEDLDFEVTRAPDCERGEADAAETDFDLILLDQQLPDGQGIELLPRLIELQPGAAIVMMTGQHDLELAIQAIQLGAADFVHKPIHTEVLQTTVDQALAKRAMAKAHQSDKPAATSAPIRGLIGRSAAMLKVSKDIALCAENAATVLITGASGTGKEVVARLIHQYSKREGPFVAVNCAAIVDTLLESELFGHEKGAFTGATARKPGKFEQAEDGTLFLDEIGELAPGLQAKLLRALQERVIERVGGTEPVRTNARVIAATHRDLFELAKTGGFREDLAYRLNVINIALPPLRERKEDIELLTKALLEKNARHLEVPPAPLTPEALRKLLAHDWPGNVRELENVLTQALVQARGSAIGPELIKELIQFKSPEPNSDTEATASPSAETVELKSLEQVEAEHIQRVLDHTGGHKGKSCDILGISRPALDRKIAKYGLSLRKH